MELRSERPIAVALVCSSVLHLAAVLVYFQWAPWSGDSARPGESTSSTMSVSLADTQANEANESQTEPSEVAKKPRANDAVKATDEPQVPAPEPVAPQQPEQIATAPSDFTPMPDMAPEPVNFNPVPTLQEEFTIDMATLAVRAPMESNQRQSLETALNHFATQLPEWTDPEQPLHWQDGDREYEIRVEHTTPTSAMDLERAVLAVSTEVDGLAMTARVGVKRMAFSHFAQVVDRWNPEISLSGDTIVGRFHSNSEVYVEADAGGGPLVTGLTTVAGRVNFTGVADSSLVFANGLKTLAARMPLPRKPFAWDTLAPGDDHVHEIGQNARILFRGDGTYEVQALGEDAAPAEVVVQQQDPWLIVADEDVELQIEGVISGSVLVYSPRRVSILGDLRYAHDPRLEPSADFLGLVSDGYVEVAAPEVTGPGDITIEAAIFAGRQFRVRKYRSQHGGRLAIYGSVTAGTMSATEPRFTTNLEFDRRLEESRPAYFPQTNRYLIEDTQAEWTIEPAALQSANTFQ